MSYTIEKGVPVIGAARNRVYPFAQMEVGDSFAAPLAKRATISTSAWAFGRIRGLKFITSKVSDTECRCWRIK